MKFEEFIAIPIDSNEYNQLSIYLKALLLDINYKWEEAHQLIQFEDGIEFAWIHAYLHRKDGDHWNASYWYSRAGKSNPSIPLNEEFKLITKNFLENFDK